jgi:Zn-finger nucleic acid-binding protein
MKGLPEIPINLFQLAVLLDEVERHFYNVVIDSYVYCAQCRGVASEGVEVEKIFLNSVNDIRVEGRCRKCNGEVGRLFEFGEIKEFYEKACHFRESIRQ